MKDTKKFHEKPFDDETLTKLHIFENYTKEWLPADLDVVKRLKRL